MIVLVCGGRNYRNYQALWDKLDAIHAKTPIDILIHGGQRTQAEHKGWIGADWFADGWARSREVACIRVSAEWKKHGKAAGPIRNSRQLWIMGKNTLPDICLHTPGGSGTADMVAKADAAGVELMPVEPEDASDFI